ncbi:demethyllactenocin mycarosyltransferase-like [Oppia nitens]|uniref:demethyllactenocin mycarosyltransferase-like n=1 Tax=Oppia nitens TaxID=1686743 RepID=UPI0023DBF7CE|nr:demethyllactenocin mycarosyltransferase-like [Oppia nitens]
MSSNNNNKNADNPKLTVLFAPSPGMGHIGACHGLADILSRIGGHRSVFALDIRFKGRLAKHGYEEAILQSIGPEPYSSTEEDLMQQFFDEYGDRLLNMTAVDVLRAIGPVFMKMFDDCKRLESNYRSVVASVRPDLIVCDTHIGSPAFMNAGRPWILLNSMSPLELYNACNAPDVLPPAWSGYSCSDQNKDKWLDFRQQLEPLFADFHQTVDDWYYRQTGQHIADSGLQPMSRLLNIYMTPDELDFKHIAGVKPLDTDNWMRVDGFVRTTNESVELPDWLLARPGKLILLSLGSLVSGNLGLMRFVTETLGKSPHKFIVSTGKHHDKYTLPENMWGQPFLPQTAIWPLVDCVVTHGGNNSTTEAFYFGKPVLLIPAFADQFDNAQRVVDTGLGYRLDRPVSSQSLLDSVHRLATDTELSVRMKQIGERIRQSFDANSRAIVERIEHIVADYELKK